MIADVPETLLEAVRYFADLSVCNEYMRRIKWPGGNVECPHCGSHRCAEKADQKRLRCKDCRKDSSYKVGTIFEDSPLGLDKWFVAVWSIANCKNGISSHELGRALGVTQKTAWFILHRIRAAMRTGTFTKLRGEVESDETFIGGEAANMHADRRAERIKGRGAVGKAIVHGLLERGSKESKRSSRVKASVVSSMEGAKLLPEIRRSVDRGALVYTDAHAGYGDLCLTHIHQAIDHATRYVSGRVHTNGLENFWSLLKRGLRGTYVWVAAFHLQRYVDEQAFRFNGRKGTDASRFLDALEGVVGKRLTYRTLAGIDDAGFMGLT